MTEKYVFFTNLLSYAVKQKCKNVNVFTISKDCFIISYRSVPRLKIKYDSKLDCVLVNNAIGMKRTILYLVNCYMSNAIYDDSYYSEKHFDLLVKCRLI